jgi:predicted methyltransferase
MNPVDPFFPPRPTALAQEILKTLIRPGDLAIDATAGNGHDTLFLAECVGPNGQVLAFDVQEAALSSARSRIEAAGLAARVNFLHVSHVEMAAYAPRESAAVIFFNLGYLPGENHDLTTESATTLAALEVAADLIRPGGALSILCYPGHPAGAAEAMAVEHWLMGKAADGWRLAKYGAIGTRRPAPFLWLAGKVG